MSRPAYLGLSQRLAIVPLEPSACTEIGAVGRTFFRHRRRRGVLFGVAKDTTGTH